MTKISYNFTRKAEQNDLIEISSCQNLRLKELEGTSEILHLSLGFIGEDSEMQTSGSCSDGPRSFRSPVEATERPEHVATSLALLSRFTEVIVTLLTLSSFRIKQNREDAVPCLLNLLISKQPQISLLFCSLWQLFP